MARLAAKDRHPIQGRSKLGSVFHMWHAPEVVVGRRGRVFHLSGLLFFHPPGGMGANTAQPPFLEPQSRFWTGGGGTNYLEDECSYKPDSNSKQFFPTQREPTKVPK